MPTLENVIIKSNEMEATEKKQAIERTWIEEWKTRLDTLKVKLELGKMDLHEGVEELEKDLRMYLAKMQTQIDALVDKNPKAKAIKARLDEMILQLNLAKAEGKDALERETRKLRDRLHAWKWDTIDWLEEKADERADKVRAALENELEFYTAQLELLNVRAHLGRSDARDKWDDLRDKLGVKLQELRSKVENKAEERWDDAKVDLANQLRKWADRLV